MAKQFPAVFITGAGQTGETSLLQQLYPSPSPDAALLMNAGGVCASHRRLDHDVFTAGSRSQSHVPQWGGEAAEWIIELWGRMLTDHSAITL